MAFDEYGEHSKPTTIRLRGGAMRTGARRLLQCNSPRLQVRQSRRTVRPGQLRRYRFSVRIARAGRWRPVADATIRFANRTLTTDANGRASVALRLRRPGVRSVRITKAGLIAARSTVRVLRR